MYWLDEIKIRLKKKNQVLFAKNSEFLQDFVRLFQGHDHRALTLWALDFAAESIAALQEKYPREKRPEAALEATKGNGQPLCSNKFCRIPPGRKSLVFKTGKMCYTGRALCIYQYKTTDNGILFPFFSYAIHR